MDNKNYSKGICWIDDCRIPFVDEGDKKESYRKPLDTIREGFVRTTKPEYKPQGRFPANILVSDDMLNDGVISKAVRNHRGRKTYSWNKDYIQQQKSFECGFNDKGSNSRYYNIDKWFDKIINE